MQEEYNSLKKNETWILVDQSKNKKMLATKWVFKKKLNETENACKFKARLVVKGCAQKVGTDYKETYSPVDKYSTIRFLLGLATRDDMDIHHMNVKT